MLRFIYKISNDLRRLGYVPNDERIRIRVAEGYWSIKVTCSPRKSWCKLLSTQQINFFRLNYLDFQIDRDLCSKLFQIMLYLHCTPITMTSGLGGFKYPNDPQNFNVHHDELIDFAVDINQSWATSKVKQQNKERTSCFHVSILQHAKQKVSTMFALCQAQNSKNRHYKQISQKPQNFSYCFIFSKTTGHPSTIFPPSIPGARNGKVDPSIKR